MKTKDFYNEIEEIRKQKIESIKERTVKAIFEDIEKNNEVNIKVGLMLSYDKYLELKKKYGVEK